MHSRRVGHCLMELLQMLRYHPTQGGYSISFLALQYWCCGHWGWDSRLGHARSCQVWNRFHVSSCQWYFWRSHPLWVLLPPGLVQGMRSVLDGRGVVLTGSPTGGGVQNLFSGADTTPVLHWQCRESHCAPQSLSVQWYFPINCTVATPLQLSQWTICKAWPQQPRWKFVQDPFHPSPVFVSYQHPKPTPSCWTRWPKPDAPQLYVRAGLIFNTCGLDHGHLVIGK